MSHPDICDAVSDVVKMSRRPVLNLLVNYMRVAPQMVHWLFELRWPWGGKGQYSSDDTDTRSHHILFGLNLSSLGSPDGYRSRRGIYERPSKQTTAQDIVQRGDSHVALE